MKVERKDTCCCVRICMKALEMCFVDATLKNIYTGKRGVKIEGKVTCCYVGLIKKGVGNMFCGYYL